MDQRMDRGADVIYEDRNPDEHISHPRVLTNEFHRQNRRLEHVLLSLDNHCKLCVLDIEKERKKLKKDFARGKSLIKDTRQREETRKRRVSFPDITVNSSMRDRTPTNANRTCKNILEDQNYSTDFPFQYRDRGQLFTRSQLAVTKERVKLMEIQNFNRASVLQSPGKIALPTLEKVKTEHKHGVLTGRPTLINANRFTNVPFLPPLYLVSGTSTDSSPRIDVPTPRIKRECHHRHVTIHLLNHPKIARSAERLKLCTRQQIDDLVTGSPIVHHGHIDFSPPITDFNEGVHSSTVLDEQLHSGIDQCRYLRLIPRVQE